MTTERVEQIDGRGKFSFEKFSIRPEYVDYNTGFVDRTLQVKPGAVILDVACGTGLISRRIFDHYNANYTEAEIIGIDPNPAALAIARQKIPGSDIVRVRFEEGKATDIKNLVEPNTVDIAYFCNAIHEIPQEQDKLNSLVAIHSSLRPGGKAFINTAFTSEMFPDRRTFAQWGRLRQRGMEILGKRKDKNKPGFGVYSVEYYCTMMSLAGFGITNVQKTPVDTVADSIRAISMYDTYIEGQLMDMEDTEKFSLEDKSSALLKAVDEAEEELRKTSGDKNAIFKLTRIWVEIEAEKPLAA